MTEGELELLVRLTALIVVNPKWTVRELREMAFGSSGDVRFVDSGYIRLSSESVYSLAQSRAALDGLREAWERVEAEGGNELI